MYFKEIKVKKKNAIFPLLLTGTKQLDKRQQFHSIESIPFSFLYLFIYLSSLVVINNTPKLGIEGGWATSSGYWLPYLSVTIVI